MKVVFQDIFKFNDFIVIIAIQTVIAIQLL